MGGIPIGRIAGFPVSVNWSVLVILWLCTWSLASMLARRSARLFDSGLLAGWGVRCADTARVAAGPRTDARDPRA
jgi:hypothetical protein